MAQITRRVFYRQAKKVGNSAGVLLPKSLLGADVKIIVARPPVRIRRDIPRLLESYLEDLLGIYILPKKTEETLIIDVIAISNIKKSTFKKGSYNIVITPLAEIKTALKQNKEFRERFFSSKVFINKKLFDELRKG